mgnify:CR=1|jgi:hypothetical protein|tara:strand:+ start:152 stop:892 length:741 start_codon:yes stop_codon:yes gene_type:complete
MKFEIDAKEFRNALTDIQGKGKYGLSNSNLNDFVYCSLENNNLELWNANTTLSLNINLQVNGQEEGEFVFDAKETIPFLKKFNDNIVVDGKDVLTIFNGEQSVTLPRIINHPNSNAISRLKGMLNHVSYETPEELFLFGNGKFEGAFTLHADYFKETIDMCELVKSGIYKLDYTGEELTISSENTPTNKYSRNLPITNSIGEAATVEWSSPLHKFFKGEINFYIKDEFPLLLIGENRKLICAPHTR